MPQHRGGLAQVGAHHGDLVAVRQQRLAMRPDHRIDVHVDHTGIRRDPLGHLVHVGLGREAATEVEVLPDSGLGG